MLSANQTTLLCRIIDAGRPVAIAEIAEWQVGGSFAFGENAARNAIKRMEDRGLVSASGVGRSRTVTVTPTGSAALSELPSGVRIGQDSSPASTSRDYIVLEQVNVEDLNVDELDQLLQEVDQIYVQRATVDARNTEHALRQTGDILAVKGDVDTTLIPVASRMWQPELVRVENRRAVTIGGGE